MLGPEHPNTATSLNNLAHLRPGQAGVTLQDRSLDFADAPLVFAGVILEIEDDRRDYTRIRTIGYLAGRA